MGTRPAIRCEWVAATAGGPSHHRDGHVSGPPAVVGFGGQVLNASGVQRGEKSPTLQPSLARDESSQALRNFAYAAENPFMLRVMGVCGSLFLPGSNPKTSFTALS